MIAGLNDKSNIMNLKKGRLGTTYFDLNAMFLSYMAYNENKALSNELHIHFFELHI